MSTRRCLLCSGSEVQSGERRGLARGARRVERKRAPGETRATGWDRGDCISRAAECGVRVRVRVRVRSAECTPAPSTSIWGHSDFILLCSFYHYSILVCRPQVHVTARARAGFDPRKPESAAELITPSRVPLGICQSWHH